MTKNKMGTMAFSALTAATLLLTGVETSLAVTPGATAMTLDPLQRQTVAATAVQHTSARRNKQPQSAVAVTPSLNATQLQQALHASNKRRGRPTGNPELIDLAQQQALYTLNASTQDQGGVQAHFDARNGTLALLKPQQKTFSVTPRTLTQGTSVPAMVAQQFLTEQRALLKLDDPQQETRLVRQSSDAITGRSRVHLQQIYQGVPLWGKELLVHTQGANGIYLVQGSYEPTPHHLNTVPTLTPEQGLATVHGDLALPTATPAQSELVIYTPEKGAPLLTYKVEIAPTSNVRWLYFINAHNGKIVHRINNIHTNVVAASGADLHGVTRTFNAWSEDGRFYLIDPNTPTPDTTPKPLINGPNPGGDTFIMSAERGDGTTLSYNSSIAQNSDWDAAAVSAAHNTRVVYDYYKSRFGRDSLDGKGMNLMVVTHFMDKFNNAFWNGTFMVYGDGDNQTFTSLAGCLDVAAHEMSHGVIEHSANLIYQNQSGALNESFADIFGAMVDADDWLMGEQCTAAAPGFLRNMKNPAQGLSPQPTKMSEYRNLPNTKEGDNGGVHINSGIPNRAAYLIAEGLSAEGLGTSIGRAKTEQIFYRALTTYLTASAQFIDARRATLQAAADLHGAGSSEVLAVTKAWDAVEVIDNSSNTPKPTSTDVVQGDDVMVYLVPGTGGAFDLYMQVMDTPFTAYNPTKDVGPLNDSMAAAYTRPAVYTDQNGTWVFYVGMDNNLYLKSPTGTNTLILNTGDIYSIAVSPDSRYFAYTSTDATDDTIHLLDLVTPTNSTSFPITPPSYQQGSSGADTIFYADAISFDYSSRSIIFDALNCISTPGDTCDIKEGTGYRYWSIGQMNVANGQLFFPFANQNPVIDLGYPSFAANNQSVIALDYQDWTDFSNVKSSIVTLNLETQELKTVYSFIDTLQPYNGIPSFWGGDDYLTFQIPDAVKDLVVVRTGIDNRWSSSGSPQSINPSTVMMPVMHRAGQRVLTGGLSTSGALLDFGTVELNTDKPLTLTLNNTGNSDVNITNIELKGGAFRHNATNTRVPRGTSLPVAITFTSTVAGSQTGTLILTTDGTPSTLTVSLVGTATPPPAPAPPPPPASSSGDGGGGGGGLFDPLWLALLITTGAAGLRYRRREG